MAKAVTAAKVISQRYEHIFCFVTLSTTPEKALKLKKPLMSAQIQHPVILIEQRALYIIVNATNTSVSFTVER